MLHVFEIGGNIYCEEIGTKEKLDSTLKKLAKKYGAENIQVKKYIGIPPQKAAVGRRKDNKCVRDAI